jgi:hypothetical protein
MAFHYLAKAIILSLKHSQEIGRCAQFFFNTNIVFCHDRPEADPVLIVQLIVGS